MERQKVEPDVQALLDEAYALPECAARDTLLESAARRAEGYADLNTAWRARCSILSSNASHAAPKFETLFMCLAWCFGVSDRDPERFSPSELLWQYKWVVTEAVGYASVPLGVLERIVDDLDERFRKAGWGARAGIHKRIDLAMMSGQLERARELVPVWTSVPRDRGSDCLACECDTLVGLFKSLGQDESAWRQARPIVRGKLSCAVVPHATFGALLRPLRRLGRAKEAKTLYERGRRLVLGLDEGGHKLAGPYILHAAHEGRVEECRGLVRTFQREALALRADLDRSVWFAHLGAAMALLERRGVGSIELAPVPGLIEEGDSPTGALASRCLEIARDHAQALDARNGNGYFVGSLGALLEECGIRA